MRGDACCRGGGASALRRRAFLVLLLLAGGTPHVRAEDAAPTHDLSEPATWPVGVTLTRGQVEETVLRIRDRTPGSSNSLSTTSGWSHRVVARCLEADAEGRATRRRMYLETWRMEAQDVLDASAEGALLEVSGIGPERRYTVLAARSLLSPRARATLDEEFGPDASPGDPVRLAGGCPKEARVGEEWEGDPEPLVRSAVEPMQLDMAAARCRFRLASADQDVYEIQVALKAPAARFPGMTLDAARTPALRWEGTFQASGARRWKRGSGHRLGDSALVQRLAGDCLAGGSCVATAESERVRSERTVETGTVPEVEAVLPAAGLEPERLVARWRFQLRALRLGAEAEAEEGKGTGFLLAPDRLVTCAHVVEGAEWVDVVLDDGRRVRAEGVLALDPARDVAILRLPEALAVSADPSVLRDAPVLPGESVAIVGYREGETLGVQAATARVFPSGPGRGVLVVDPGMGPGSSGSVVVDAEGRVVGLNAARAAGGTGIAVPVAWILALDHRASVPGTPVEALAGTEAAAGHAERARTRVAKVVRDLRRGRVGAALGGFLSLKAGDLDPPEVLELLAESLAVFGRFEEAQRLLALAEVDQPLSAVSRQLSGPVHLRRAVELHYWKLGSRAVAAWIRALRLVPTDPGVHRFRVRLGVDSGDLTGVLPSVAFLRRRGLLEPDLHLQVAYALLRGERAAEAVDTLEDLVGREPENAVAWNLLASGAIRVQDLDLTWRAAVHALARDPSQTGAWFSLGWLEGEAGHDAQALEHYRRGLEGDPTNAKALYSAGIYAHRSGDALAAEGFLARLGANDAELAATLRAALGR